MWKRTIKPDDWCKKYHLFIIFHMWNATISWTPFWRSQSYFHLTRWFLIFLSKKAQNLRNGEKRLLKNTSSRFISPNCDIMIIIITLRVEVITLLFIETRWCGFYSSFFYIMRVCGVSIVIFEALLTILEREGWYFNLTQSNKISSSICQNLLLEKTIRSGNANKWKHKKC